MTEQDAGVSPPPETNEEPAEVALKILRSARDRFVAYNGVAERWLARFDPNDDPEAEPLGVFPLLALLAALTWVLFLYFRFPFQPMQDLGHHIALAAVVADYHHRGSLYPALYEEPVPYYANSLLYFVAGVSGRLIGVVPAVRMCVAFYLAGVPLANLYALRVFGRSAWPAVITTLFVYYNLNFVAGFVNILFAGPFMVLLIPVFFRALRAPSWKRVALAALFFIAVFLAHAQSYLWVGALAFVMTLAGVTLRIFAPGATLRERLLAPLQLALASFLSVLPSLGIFALWYSRTFGEGRTLATNATAGLDNDFGAWVRDFPTSFSAIGTETMRALFQPADDLGLMVRVFILAALATSAARLYRLRGLPILEFAAVITFGSYFFLPEGITGQEVIASRQIGIGLWFISPFFTPVPASVSRVARYLVIFGILRLTYNGLGLWSENLYAFERTEASNIACVLDPAPPRRWLHYVKLVPDTSHYFLWKPTWHVEKYYMGEKFGQVSDNPAINATSPIRYRQGVSSHRITVHPHDWYKMEELWNNYELVVIHGWDPTPDALDAAKEHGVRIRKCGNWELWRKHGPWESGAAPVE